VDIIIIELRVPPTPPRPLLQVARRIYGAVDDDDDDGGGDRRRPNRKYNDLEIKNHLKTRARASDVCI